MDTSAIAIAIVAALIGSTGIAGFLTAGVQWTRSARLRRAIESHAKLIDAVGAETAGGKALAKANQVDSLRLAATTLLRPPQMVWMVLAALALTVFVLVLSFAAMATLSDFSRSSSPFSRTMWLVMAGASLAYIVAAVFALDFNLRRRRERFVRAVTQTGRVSRKVIREHDFGANRRDDFIAERTRKRSAELEKKFAADFAKRSPPASPASPEI